MQRSVNSLIGYKISALDGELGKVNEFLFDDLTWSIRYLVVKTGGWASKRMAIIPRSALGVIDWESQTFKVNLTVEQVRNSPDIETQRTVFRQHEIELLNHYGLPIYWGDGRYDDNINAIPLASSNDVKKIKNNDNSINKLNDDPHLRNTKIVAGYHIHAIDGKIGHVEDYIVDDEKWNICSLIIDTHNWLPGRKVLILPLWIYRIDWEENIVYVNLSKEKIENSPEFNPAESVNQEYERELIKHYAGHVGHLG